MGFYPQGCKELDMTEHNHGQLDYVFTLHDFKDFTSFNEKFLQSLGRWSQRILVAVENIISQKDKKAFKNMEWLCQVY